MATVHLPPFAIDDLTLAWIDRTRGRMSREAFFHRLIQYGLCNAFEELAKLSRDFAAQDTSTKTAMFQQGRDLFSVEPAHDAEEAAPEEEAA